MEKDMEYRGKWKIGMDFIKEWLFLCFVLLVFLVMVLKNSLIVYDSVYSINVNDFIIIK